MDNLAAGGQDRAALEKRLERLVELITELKEGPCLAELEALLAQGVEPLELLGCFMEGMRRVGEYFENGRYFIAGLIMAGEIMRLATETLQPYLGSQGEDQGYDGKVLLGTIQGDIHDLGKNLFSILLRCHRFKVIDLGVDVPAQVFMEESIRQKPDIIGMSCVLTNSVVNLRLAVDLLRYQHPKPAPPVLIGGTCLDARMAKQVGADFWASDAAGGLRICQKIISAK